MPNATSSVPLTARDVRHRWFVAIVASLACSGALAADKGQAVRPPALAELAGPDRNDDGIRDDLEGFATKTFGDDARVLRAVQKAIAVVTKNQLAVDGNRSSLH